MLFTPPKPPGYNATPQNPPSWLRWTECLHGLVAYRVVRPTLNQNRPVRFVVLFAHGNACDIADEQLLRSSQAVANALHADVYLYDYCGYGQSPKACGPSAACTAVTTDAMYKRALVYSRAKGARFVLLGHSLGAAVLCHLMASAAVGEDAVAAAVLISAFVTPMGVLHPVLRIFRGFDRYDNASELQALGDENKDIPIAFVTATADSVIDPRDTLELYRCYKARKCLVELDGADHMAVLDYPQVMVYSVMQSLDQLKVIVPTVSRPFHESKPAHTITEPSNIEPIPTPSAESSIPKRLAYVPSETSPVEVVPTLCNEELTSAEHLGLESLMCFFEGPAQPEEKPAADPVPEPVAAEHDVFEVFNQ